MLRKSLILAAAAALATSAAFAGSAKPNAKNKKHADTKVVEVKTCPITGEAVKGKGAGSETVGKYKVYFCCGGCQPAFDKLTQKDKEKKITDVLKKSAKGAKAAPKAA